MQHSDHPVFSGLSDDVRWRWETFDAAGWDKSLAILSEKERGFLEHFRSEKRIREFVLGRVAARRLIGDHADVDPQSVDLHIANDGAVEVAGNHKLHLSISHADGWASAAISQRPVGIDMERVTYRRPGTYRRFLSVEEYALLEDTEFDHDRVQILLWTLKEAVLKGTRTGLRISPKLVRIQSMEKPGVAEILDSEDSAWQVSWIFWRNCYLAIADRENLK